MHLVQLTLIQIRPSIHLIHVCPFYRPEILPVRAAEKPKPNPLSKYERKLELILIHKTSYIFKNNCFGYLQDVFDVPARNGEFCGRDALRSAPHPHGSREYKIPQKSHSKLRLWR